MFYIVASRQLALCRHGSPKIEKYLQGKPLQLVFNYDNKDYAFDLRS